MVLIPPKRLFHIKSMQTFLYEDVADDVRDKGYVAVSHVWGDQKKYKPKELGIVGGVDWEVPLSDTTKMLRMKEAMLDLDEEYCWFDVLCMPQDKQEEINREISLMGDYYAGADTTLVFLTIDYIHSEEFIRWYDMVAEVMETERDFTYDEINWTITLEGHNLLDMAKDQWLHRVWTFQEAVLSKKIILVDLKGSRVNLSNIIAKLRYAFYKCQVVLAPFSNSLEDLLYLGNAVDHRMNGGHDLVSAISENCRRDCYKEQDRFYGMLGILGYKDFPVDYDADMNVINKKIVQHAYSKGDVSWLAAVGNAEGFIPQIYEISSYVGESWKEDEPNICNIRFEDDALWVNMWSFATVVRSTDLRVDELPDDRVLGETFRVCKEWGLDGDDITSAIMRYADVPGTVAGVAKMFLEDQSTGVSNPNIVIEMISRFGRGADKRLLDALTIMVVPGGMSCARTAVKAISNETGDFFPLIIFGNADEGDEIRLVRMHDKDDRTLGIVVSELGKRKGVCLYRKIEMSEEDVVRHYIPHEFLL